ncbi:carotenoid biosynthesis protein [Spongiivirga sp. MCCC 1A20706]|uniref:carotenoid biosynthesis protein n=1 Tax=Spongiivirga sp. MCCC 1A20706 TaxID=3160963 RepID=UPI0039779825
MTLTKNNLACFIIILFHVTAVIGVSIGFQDWFIAKTPLNLLVVTVLFFILFPIASKRNIILFLMFFGLSIFAEWLGVTYGLIFGEYSYGANFGPKVSGVPLFIGAKWAILTFVSSRISHRFLKSKWLISLSGASFMLLLDFFMEKSAPVFDFWEFKGGIAPLQNYVGWFGLAFLFQYILNIKKNEGNLAISYTIYFAQLLFFLYFFFYNS